MIDELEHGFEPDDFNFDIDTGIDTDLNFETRYIKPPKLKELQEYQLKYQSAAKLARDLVIDPGARYFILIDGKFVFGDLIEALIVEKNYRVKDLTIQTLSFSENNVDSINNLIEGEYLDRINIITSPFFYSHEKHNLINYAYKILDKDDRFQLAIAAVHTKVTTIETYCGKKIVLHGSANLRSSNNIEQLVIEESPAIFDYMNEFSTNIINKYQTINKAVRGKELWQNLK